jgi:hypothetical protein
MIPDLSSPVRPATKPTIIIDPVANGFIVRDRGPEFGATVAGDTRVFTDAKSLGDFITKVYQCFESPVSESACKNGEPVEWHNPLNLTPEQVGVSEGWRLLTKQESNACVDRLVHDVSTRTPDATDWTIVGSFIFGSFIFGNRVAVRTKLPITTFVRPTN